MIQDLLSQSIKTIMASIKNTHRALQNYLQSFSYTKACYALKKNVSGSFQLLSGTNCQGCKETIKTYFYEFLGLYRNTKKLSKTRRIVNCQKTI